MSLSLLLRYKWRQFVAVYTDNRFGRNGITALMTYLLEKKASYVHIAQRVPVKSTWTADDVAQALAASRAVDSSVYVLHASSTMSALILDTASKLGMIGKNYVWIASEGAAQANTSTLQSAEVESDNHSVLSPAIEAPGLIITASYYHPPSQRLLASKQLSAQQPPGAAEEDPKAYSLAAYTTGFQVSLTPHGDLQADATEVLNVVNATAMRVGFWTPAWQLTRSLKRPSKNQQEALNIVFPGGVTQVPIGAFPKTKLRLAVPNKVVYKQFVNISKGEGKERFSGFCIDVFRAAVAMLPYPLDYEFVQLVLAVAAAVAMLPYPLEYEFVQYGRDNVSPSYTDMVLAVADKVDAGCLGIMGYAKENSSPWLAFQPFTASMWGVTMALCMLAGLITSFLDEQSNEAFREKLHQRLQNATWFGLQTLYAILEYPVRTSLARLFVIVFLIIGYLIVTMYTANLTSIVTVNRLKPSAMDIGSAASTSSPIGYQLGSFINAYLQQMGIPAVCRSVLDSAVQLSMQKFLGLYIIFGTVSLGCCLLYVLLLIHRGYRASREAARLQDAQNQAEIQRLMFDYHPVHTGSDGPHGAESGLAAPAAGVALRGHEWEGVAGAAAAVEKVLRRLKQVFFTAKEAAVGVLRWDRVELVGVVLTAVAVVLAGVAVEGWGGFRAALAGRSAAVGAVALMLLWVGQA
ncbi:unnamed protein product [Closterium sp. Naga37s-1]|nr:unnamed protein product [Closterium sp. Naga37s-1]